MSDTPAPKSKPMWTRCPSCKDRIFNDKLDVGIHRGHCPADLQRSLQQVLRKFEELRTAVGHLDEQVSEAPALDVDEVAEWTDDDTDEQTITEAGVDRSGAVAYFAADDEDDVDYGATVPLSGIR